MCVRVCVCMCVCVCVRFHVLCGACAVCAGRVQCPVVHSVARVCVGRVLCVLLCVRGVCVLLCAVRAVVCEGRVRAAPACPLVAANRPCTPGRVNGCVLCVHAWPGEWVCAVCACTGR